MLHEALKILERKAFISKAAAMLALSSQKVTEKCAHHHTTYYISASQL